MQALYLSLVLLLVAMALNAGAQVLEDPERLRAWLLGVREAFSRILGGRPRPEWRVEIVGLPSCSCTQPDEDAARCYAARFLRVGCRARIIPPPGHFLSASLLTRRDLDAMPVWAGDDND